MGLNTYGLVMRPLVTIFAMQSVITMAIYSLPVIFPIAAPDLGVEPESVGFFIAIVYSASTLAGLFCNALISALGATGVFRLLLVFTGLSIIALLISTPLAVIAAAILLGIGSGPMNPTGSHILAKSTPPDRRAFVFSIKQCATPAGGMLAGILLPPLALAFGWQWALMIIPIFAVVLFVLAFVGNLGRRELAAARQTFSFSKTISSLRIVLKRGPIRNLSVATTGLAAAQMALTTYLVVYLWREVGLTEAGAGLVFSALHISGIVARVCLGFVADRFQSAKWILVVICVVLSAALVAIGLFSQDWPLPAIYCVVIVAGATGNGWVGLYYAELARLSPDNRIAEVTAASQFFTYIGLVTGPILFGALLAFSSSYWLTLIFFAIIMLLGAIFLSTARMQRD